MGGPRALGVMTGGARAPSGGVATATTKVTADGGRSGSAWAIKGAWAASTQNPQTSPVFAGLGAGLGAAAFCGEAAAKGSACMAPAPMAAISDWLMPQSASPASSAITACMTVDFTPANASSATARKAATRLVHKGAEARRMLTPALAVGASTANPRWARALRRAREAHPPEPAPSVTPAPAHRFSVAPMMDWTDRHCRAFHRTLTARALLYTEMVTAPAILNGDRQRLVGFDAVEHPVVLQLGGSNPAQLAEAARIGEGFGYDEINLNVGCPSDRVQGGDFGACLMRKPQLVAECMGAIGAVVSVPATVKCRIGVDEQDPEEALFTLVDACAAAGVTSFAVHARKAWLQGLSPKENRDIPPLDYALVDRLKQERPHLTIVLNGGLSDLDTAQAAFDRGLDGAMLGRAAYHDPGLLGEVDRRFFDGAETVSAVEAVERFRPYLAARLQEGVNLAHMTRHMLGLFAGRPGARAWRRVLTVESVKAGAGLEVLDHALAQITGEARAAA